MHIIGDTIDGLSPVFFISILVLGFMVVLSVSSSFNEGYQLEICPKYFSFG